MLSKENTKEQVIDNQMDYVDDESTIGAKGDEDRLSSEELRCGRSQKSPGVTRSSSISSSSIWYSMSSDTANGVSLIDNEVVEKATFFVKTFVQKFEEELSSLSKEAKPGSKIRKTGRIVGQIDSTIKSAVPPGVRIFPDVVTGAAGYLPANEHRKRAKKVYAAIVPLEDEIRKTLVESGLEIFQSFEEQMTKVMDISWKRGIEKLAIDAVSRVISYISTSNEEGEFPAFHITKGVILGKSKIDTFAKQVLHKPARFFKSKAFQPGYQVKDKQSDKTLITSELYEKVGIKKTKDGGKYGNIKYYKLKEHDCAEKYGYRLPFAWELEEWEELQQKYVSSKTPEEEYVHILDEEKKKGLASNILKEINGNDPAQKKDIEILCEKLENSQIKKEESRSPFSFNLGCLPEFFIRREMMLDELKKKLSSKNQEVEMSRMVLIHGEYGTGKSELARSYGYNKGEDSNVWTNVIWIDARVYGTLLDSFHRLAERLKIPTKNGQEINADIEVKEQQERGIKSIVKDIYPYFRDIKSLFIFDNANGYKEIEKFLPSYFSDLFFGKEKPYVLITSRNKDWKKEIEKIELDDGFLPEEAIAFIRKVLKVTDRSQDCYLVELAQALSYLPLALKQATAYIKQEGINIIKYLEHYDKAMKESNLDYFEISGISPELFTTLKVNFDKIRREKNIGQQSHDIVTHMAYLSPDQIDIEEIFLQKKSEKDKQQVLDVLDRLHKFSVIGLEESIARVHKGIQKTVRVEEERAGTEEETLRKIMTSYCLINPNHIISVWSNISKYNKLVNEFIDFIYDGSTILHLLAKDGNEEVIKLILEKIDSNKLSKIINAVDEADFTSLDYAVMHGHLGIVQRLVGKGGDINLKNKKGMCLLHFAAMYGHLDVAKYLVTQGAIVKSWNKDSMCPLHFAAIYGHSDIVEYLVMQGNMVEPLNKDIMSSLHFAAIYGHLDIVKYLIEKGASVDLQDKGGMSSLHYAVINGRLDIVKYLIGKRADANLQSKEGESPLYFAVIHGHLDIVEYLVRRGANVNLKDKNGISPFDYATINCHSGKNHSEIVQYFKDVCSASDLKTQSHKRHLKTSVHLNESKKRKLENVSAISEKNASNIQLLQGSQNLPSDISMRFEDESTVNLTNRIPMFSFNSVAVEPVNNKSLRR